MTMEPLFAGIVLETVSDLLGLYVATTGLAAVLFRSVESGRTRGLRDGGSIIYRDSRIEDATVGGFFFGLGVASIVLGIDLIWG